MSIAIFDLDNTLLNGDSDYLWGRFLVSKGLVDQSDYETKNAAFYQQYCQGTLDIYEFLNFALQPLAQYETVDLLAWREEFVETWIKPIIIAKASDLVAKHRAEGQIVMVITATNRFITEAIADLYAVDYLLATRPEMKDGRFTGKVQGIPCFQEGKVENLNAWLSENQETLEDSWFYTDSHNDLPLLRRVTHPVAVNPDDRLRSIASENGWPILDFINPSSAR